MVYSSQKERDAVVRQTNKARALALLGGGCTECGSEDGLEFDHIDRSNKTFTLGRYMHLSWKKLFPELLKCQLLCKQHHRAKTSSEGPWNKGLATHGKLYSAYVLLCTCTTCLEYRHARNLSRRKGQ